MDIPHELKYTKEHEWVRIEGDAAFIGITDYAQDALGDVVFLELQEEGTEFEKGDGFGVVESVKAVSDLYSPITGEILEVNEALIDDPDKINDNPYDDGWMIKVKIEDEEELKELLSAEDYEDFVKEISED